MRRQIFKHTRGSSAGAALGPNLITAPNGPYTGAPWAGVNVGATGSQTDPLGGSTASGIDNGSATGQHYVRFVLSSLSVGQKYHFAAYIKAGTYTATPLVLNFFAGGQYAAANYDVSSHAIATDGLNTMTLSNLSATAAGNGFFLVSFDFICNNSTAGEFDVSFNNYVSFTGGFQNFILWGCSLQTVN